MGYILEEEMREIVKSTLFDARQHFAVAFKGDKENTDKYILGVFNTVILNDKLMQCSPDSIRDAAITSAVLGVAIDARQYAYLIPYNNKAQFQMSYKGYVHVAKRDPDVDNIWSNIVYEGDTFSIDLGANTISHIPNLENPFYGSPEHIKYVYAMVRFRSNTGRAQMFEVMTKKQIDGIRASSKAGGEVDKYGKPTIWASNYGEMGRKTAIKRLCKHAQLGDVARLDEVDNSIEQGKIINVTPSGELKVDDSVREDKEAMLALIDACITQEQLNKVFSDNAEKMEELTATSASSEINKASKAKKDNFEADKIIDYLSGCEDLESLEKVYNNWERSLKGLTAASRNKVINYYCELKQTFTEMAA